MPVSDDIIFLQSPCEARQLDNDSFAALYVPSKRKIDSERDWGLYVGLCLRCTEFYTSMNETVDGWCCT